MPQGKRSTEQNCARREADRERYNQPRPRSLLQEPTEQVRRRTLAGALLQVEPGSVSDETLAELELLIPELIGRLREHPSREDTGPPMVGTSYYPASDAEIHTQASQRKLACPFGLRLACKQTDKISPNVNVYKLVKKFMIRGN